MCIVCFFFYSTLWIWAFVNVYLYCIWNIFNLFCYEIKKNNKQINVINSFRNNVEDKKVWTLREYKVLLWGQTFQKMCCINLNRWINQITLFILNVSFTLSTYPDLWIFGGWSSEHVSATCYCEIHIEVQWTLGHRRIQTLIKKFNFTPKE